MIATAPAVNTPVQHIVLEHVSWETYESLLADYVDQSAPHFTYDQGKLEIVSPTFLHDADAQTIAAFMLILAEEWGFNFRNVGSATFRREDQRRGFEADMTYYIQHERQVRDKQEVQLPADPPPDLVVEVEVTNAAIAKLPIYADMGVLEIWRLAGDNVMILALENGEYQHVGSSLALPQLNEEMVSRFLQQSRSLPLLEWIREVRSWAREHSSA